MRPKFEWMARRFGSAPLDVPAIPGPRRGTRSAGSLLKGRIDAIRLGNTQERQTSDIWTETRVTAICRGMVMTVVEATPNDIQAMWIRHGVRGVSQFGSGPQRWERQRKGHAQAWMMLRASGIEASWKMSDPTVLTSVLMLPAMISAG
jgi:hypothetical protein